MVIAAEAGVTTYTVEIILSYKKRQPRNDNSAYEPSESSCSYYLETRPLLLHLWLKIVVTVKMLQRLLPSQATHSLPSTLLRCSPPDQHENALCCGVVVGCISLTTTFSYVATRSRLPIVEIVRSECVHDLNYGPSQASFRPPAFTDVPPQDFLLGRSEPILWIVVVSLCQSVNGTTFDKIPQAVKMKTYH